jgi:hypothetical protein
MLLGVVVVVIASSLALEARDERYIREVKIRIVPQGEEL